MAAEVRGKWRSGQGRGGFGVWDRNQLEAAAQAVVSGKPLGCALDKCVEKVY